MTIRNVYLDSRAAPGGDGTRAAPLQTLASLVWATISGWVAAGDEVFLWLARGAVFEEILQIGASGAAGRPICAGVYGGYGLPPEIRGNGTYAVSGEGVSYLVFNNLICKERVAFAVGGNITLNNMIVRDSSSVGLSLWGTVDVKMYHNAILNSRQAGIMLFGPAPSLELYNSIVLGNCRNGASGDRGIYLFPGGASLTYGNNLIAGNHSAPDSLISQPQVWADPGSTLVDAGGNLLSQIPKFASYPSVPSECIFVICTDDGAFPYNTDLAAALNPLGVHLTAFVIGAMVQASASDQASLAAFAAAGNEVGLHGWSHSDMSKSVAFTVSTTNADPTITVDVAGHQIILGTSTPGNAVTFDWSGGKNIAHLQAAVNGKGWTVTGGESMDYRLTLASLADSGGAQAVPYEALLDSNAPDYAFWREEMAAKTYLESLGHTIKTMAMPFNGLPVEQATFADYVKALGIEGIRVSFSFGGSYLMSSVNVYKLTGFDAPGNIKEPDGLEATVRRNARDMYVNARMNREIYIINPHDDTDLTAEQLAWLVDELQQCGAVFKTMGEAVAGIKASHASADGITYTKSFPDYSNFRPALGSPLYKGGVAVAGVTEDIEGHVLDNPPNIGPYGGVVGAAGLRRRR